MTFFHFLNCMALTFAPYAITYKYSGLAEYSSVWKCAQAGIVYFLTQLAKLMVLATFFPTMEHEGERFDFLAEFMKSTVDFVDLVGMYVIISRSLAGKGEVRYVAAALGWAAADAIATRLLPFWVGARGLGFDWIYIQMGLESNFNLIHYFAVCTLIWLWSRADLPSNMRNVAVALLVYAAYRNLIFEIFIHVFHLVGWPLLFTKFALTLAVGSAALALYGSIPRRENGR